MHKVVMSICDPVMKNQICNHEDYKEIDNKQNTLGPLKIIKKTMYSNGEDNTHMGYNHVIDSTNYYHVQQERYQSLQEYSDQFVAYRKLCEQLGIKSGASKNGSANMLKRMKIANPTQQRKDKAEKKAIEEHHAILFILGADKYKYGKLIEETTSSTRKIHFQIQSEKLVTYYPNGRITMGENTTMNKVTQMMIWPSQL